ncbi:MAG: NYN domain-containing protein [Ignavibacteria bacterium]|nr:NYN domain-containing protein [Ignavibacteria bacterium]
MKRIIIDCNNLLHKIPSLKAMHSSDMQGAAMALRDFVRSRYAGREKITFVFDGYGRNEGAGVIYSGKLTADEIIRQMITDSRNGRELIIVSSDTGITMLAKECSCRVIPSEKFANDLSGNTASPARGKNVNEIIEKPDRSTRKELEEYKKLFT